MDYRTGVRDVLGTRFELRLGDAMDSEIDRKLAANIPLERPGRGIMQAKYHFLGALPRVDGDNNAGSLGNGVQKLVTAVRDAWSGPAGPKLRLLPTLITQQEVRRLAPATTTMLLGINERALAPVGLDVNRDPHLLVFGNGQSGKSALLRTYMSEVTRLYTPETAQLFMVDYRRANLGEFPDEWVADYATNAQTAAELAGGLAEFLRDRLPGGGVTPEQLRNRSWWEGKEAFVIVDDYELVATSQGNPLDPLVPLLAQAVDIGLHVVVARRTGGAGRMYDNLVTGLRDLAQPGLLLSGDASEGALVGQLRAVPAVPGRARMLTRDGYNLVQIGWTPSIHTA
jgi:S-DNA-T family DNA segregation ATPase FtsK/SpoIIIE